MLENISEFYLPIVVIACLIVGYCLKKIVPLDNKWIPTVLAVTGAALGVISAGLSLETVVYGALSGLASTGLHQLFTQIIEGESK
ncbi:phage holin family protein [Pseudolactococcus yaeyamensis]